MRTYFNENGVVVMQKDAHDNKITYTYTDGIHFSKITDSVGREILFHYTGEEDEQVLSSITVQGKEAAVASAKRPLHMKQKKNPIPRRTVTGFRVILSPVPPWTAAKKKYSYKTVERLVNTAGAGVASQRVSTNQSYLLNKITADGSETHYEYRGDSSRARRDESARQDRDVVTEQFYVTREYEKDTKTGKKSGGTKYDYFQKKGENSLRSYDDFREKEEGESSYEMWPYGGSAACGQ